MWRTTSRGKHPLPAGDFKGFAACQASHLRKHEAQCMFQRWKHEGATSLNDCVPGALLPEDLHDLSKNSLSLTWDQSTDFFMQDVQRHLLSLYCLSYPCMYSQHMLPEWPLPEREAVVLSDLPPGWRKAGRQPRLLDRDSQHLPLDLADAGT